ncbi:MAG: iron-sulfur cluster assembly protein [Dehalococcoidia bacterium]|jgi:metal-sulfur cluster biosynthetic enzyme|nr:MAG: Metal-sulfur cluster biosynthetic enzyme [Chloroflexota bacterium]|tara:strand:+ start:4727 stop:5071 length:345 start_codon:yes stop_codon:yes gene_type:complete
MNEEKNDDLKKEIIYDSDSLLEVLKAVEDPELKMSIVELGLIYDVTILEDKSITVNMTLTSPGCPVGPLIQSQIYYKLMDLDGIDDVEVNIVWDPPWDPKIMASDEVKLMLGIF